MVSLSWQFRTDYRKAAKGTKAGTQRINSTEAGFCKT